jgi:hypothetical protein
MSEREASRKRVAAREKPEKISVSAARFSRSRLPAGQIEESLSKRPKYRISSLTIWSKQLPFITERGDHGTIRSQP